MSEKRQTLCLAKNLTEIRKDPVRWNLGSSLDGILRGFWVKNLLNSKRKPNRTLNEILRGFWTELWDDSEQSPKRNVNGILRDPDKILDRIQRGFSKGFWAVFEDSILRGIWTKSWTKFKQNTSWDSEKVLNGNFSGLWTDSWKYPEWAGSWENFVMNSERC